LYGIQPAYPEFCHMRTLVIGDIHGGLRALEQVLGRAQVGTNDLLIFLGDYVDGWSEAVETVNFLIGLRERNRCVLLRGNHDSLCQEWLRYGRDNPLWLRNGGEATMNSYEKWGIAVRERHLGFYDSLLNYHLDNSGRLFIHAGFTNLNGVEHEYSDTAFYWDRTLWELAVSIDPAISPSDERYPRRLANYREIYIGHTPVTRMGRTLPVKAANVWNIDTGAAFRGRLTAMDVETGEVWQSDSVYTLYPGERGRN
jgi:serine/threonine protein phosphatase 1